MADSEKYLSFSNLQNEQAVVGFCSICGERFFGPRSLSAVSEAPTSEDLSFRCVECGRCERSDLKEAAAEDYGISRWMSLASTFARFPFLSVHLPIFC